MDLLHASPGPCLALFQGSCRGDSPPISVALVWLHIIRFSFSLSIYDLRKNKILVLILVSQLKKKRIIKTLLAITTSKWVEFWCSFLEASALKVSVN